MMNLDGGIHYASWFEGGGDSRSSLVERDWSKSTEVLEKEIMWNWATSGLGRMNYGSPERIDQALRLLAADIGLELGEVHGTDSR